MLKVGDKVTRNGSRKIWEIAEVEKVGAAFSSQLAIASYGGPDARVYRLRDTATGKIQRNLWWGENNLKSC